MRDIMEQIKLLDPVTATETEIAALNQFEQQMASEARRVHSLIPLEATAADLRTVAQFDVSLGLVGADVDIATWAAWDPAGAVLGSARIMTEDRAENQHLAVFSAGVLPGARRSGLGKALLERVAAEAGVRERTVLLAATDSRVPSGEEFVRKLDGQMGVVTHAMELSTARVDVKLLRRWSRRSRERAGWFELGLWEGPYPDDALNAIVPLLTEIMNAEPRGELEVEDDSWSPEQLRQIEAALWERNLQRSAIYAREANTGEYAGYTEIYPTARRPELIVQGLTGVAARFRDRGIGRWLKAAMLARILERLPDVRTVRTSVGESNAAMLRINQELGFEIAGDTTHWQLRIEDVRSYLAG